MILSTNTTKSKFDDAQRQKRGMAISAEGGKINLMHGGKLVAQLPKRAGGVFNFDGNRYPNVVKRTTNHPKGAIFTSHLRDIQGAKERKAKAVAIARSKAIRAKQLADAVVARAALAVKPKDRTVAKPVTKFGVYSAPLQTKKDVERLAKKTLSDLGGGKAKAKK